MKTYEELLEFNKNRRFTQICLCTNRPLEEVLDEWIEKLQIGPWRISTMSNETVKDYGWGDCPIEEPFLYYVATAMAGDIQFEIIHKEYGPFMADKFLKLHGEGIQHIKEVFSDDQFPAAVDHYSQIFEKTFFGRCGDNKFCSFDSDEIVGFTLEVGNDLKSNRPRDQYRYYPVPADEKL